mmetsp:Transcript_61/g.91  ORF Transcript_61/g.91 Transcript_61/m.91 type:complete len:101 (-) Transcript_61:4344-4646(-)
MKTKIKILKDKTSFTFCLSSEGHSLGNLLKYLIQTNERVKKITYNLSHPTEKSLKINIEVHSGFSEWNELVLGFKNCMELCSLVSCLFSEIIDQNQRIRI